MTEVYKAFIRKPKDLIKIYKKWAIVTGCTDGIGKAYCFELVRKGFNIVMLSRNEEKLSNLEEELQRRNGFSSFKKMAIDFSNFNETKMEELKELLKPISNEIGILINNVGVSYEFPEYYNSLRPQQKSNIVSVNVSSTQKMIDLILPLMLKTPRKIGQRKGAIVNVSSALSFLPGGWLSLYSASKAFIDRLTFGLYSEYFSLGVDFQVQHMFLVATKMSRMRPAVPIVCTPEQCAKSAVNCIGYGPSEVPYWGHRLQFVISNYLPAALIEKALNWQHKNVRIKGLRSKARKMDENK